MAGKRDEVFLLGDEEIGADPWSVPEDEPTTTRSVPRSSRSAGLRVSWPLTLGVLTLVVAVALLARPGGDGAAPAPPAESPAVVTSPKAANVRPPREGNRPHRVSERRSPQPHPENPHRAAEEPAPLTEAASAPVITYAPASKAVPEPTPEDTAAVPAQAAPPVPARPEFGIER